MVIRGAIEKDFGIISSMIKEEYMKHYSERWTKANAIKTLEYFSGVGKIFVIEIDGRVLGVVIVREEYYNNRKSLMVEELVVRGDVQGKGIGRKLMEFVEGDCRENGIKFIWLITGRKARAFEFYKRIGYKLGEDTVYFSKELG
ncbi:MAG: GNAT family N-acetyltransferase [Nanoarchaeota archaeon]|nr:GNAT family N-acetyltransferase [Nanoarchaeota archaeon]